MEKYVPNISGFTDFLCWHSHRPIFLVNGHLVAGYCLNVRLDSAYNFTFEESQVEIERGIAAHMYMFDVLDTKAFYYAYDNMFGGDNEMRYIPGKILTLKPQYVE